MKTYVLLFIIFGLYFLYNFYYFKIKRKIGEYIVAFLLSNLPKDEYLIINDVMLKVEDGTTQIDHIIISKYGIFVIETKNFKGWIYGKEFADKWTQNLFGHKYHFMNPIRQNYGHVKTLEKLLELDESMFIPIVVFSINSNLKVKSNSLVIYTLNLNKHIKKYKDVIILQNINELKDKILLANVNTKEVKRKHVEDIHKNINEYQHNICPKCGGKLVAKKGKYGYFKGCSNYPNCTYISRKKKYK